MQFDIVTIFPEIFTAEGFKGVVGQAIANQKICLNKIDLRKFSDKKYKQVDDRPFGGGDGMIYRADILSQAIRSIPKKPQSLSIYLTPQGKLFNQNLARQLTEKEQIIFVCGRYGGVDERVLCTDIDLELSIGDYVLSGGELAAMVVIDVVARLKTGILGNENSIQHDSFGKSGIGRLLEAPQFTHPRVFEGMSVPEVLLSGHHQKIADWKKNLSILRTLLKKPYLIGSSITEDDKKAAYKLYQSLSEEQCKIYGLPFCSL